MNSLPLLPFSQGQALTDETIWAILNDEISDQMANQLVWYYLGYRYHPDSDQWDISQVETTWQQDYPQPPNFIESRSATVKLTRSIPPENKQLLKEQLGFKGYKIGEFGPRQTRRATIANWLLSHRKMTSNLLP